MAISRLQVCRHGWYFNGAFFLKIEDGATIITYFRRQFQPGRQAAHPTNYLMLLTAVILLVISILLRRLAKKFSHSRSRRKSKLTMPLNIIAFACGLAAVYCFYLVLDASDYE